MKRSLFYSFITLLLTALCIASGVTYAYFSNEQTYKGNVNNEALKLDLSLSNLVVKEKGVIKDSNNLDCGFKISINNDILTIESGDTSNMQGNGCDINFDIIVTNNTNTNMLFYYDYRLLNSKNQYNELRSLKIDSSNNYRLNSYLINAHETKKVTANIFLNDKSSYDNQITEYFVKNNEFKEQLDVKFYTTAFLNNTDFNKYVYIGDIMDDYCGIYKVDTTDQLMNCLSLSEDCPFFIYNNNNQFKLEKINPSEDSFIKVERIKSSQYDSKDNYLSFKVSFKNLCFDNTVTTLNFATYIPNIHCNKDSLEFDLFEFDYLSNNLTHSDISADNNILNNIIYTGNGDFSYNKDNFILCEDEYKEVFTAQFYFYKGGL